MIHPRNQYMVHLTKSLGLDRTKDFPETLTFGLYDGNEIVFQTKRYPIFEETMNNARMLIRYGTSLPTLNPWIAETLGWFSKIYPAQLTMGASFSSVYQLLHNLSSVFDELVSSSIGDYLQKIVGMGQLFTEELARTAMRINYGQDLGIPGFVGAVSMAGFQGGLWSVNGGNFRVAEEALTKSKAKISLLFNWLGK